MMHRNKDNFIPPWKSRLEKKVSETRKILSKLSCIIWSERTHKQIQLLVEHNISNSEDLRYKKEYFKETISAWSSRIRRYFKRSEQNKIYRENK